MCYRAEAYIRPEAACDREQLAKLGWLGIDSDEPLGLVDPLDKDGGGAVVVRQHPEMLIAQQPELWRVIDEWATGARRSIDARDRRRLSNWEISALSIMSGAYAREQRRQVKAGGE